MESAAILTTLQIPFLYPSRNPTHHNHRHRHRHHQAPIQVISAYKQVVGVLLHPSCPLKIVEVKGEPVKMVPSSAVDYAFVPWETTGPSFLVEVVEVPGVAEVFSKREVEHVSVEELEGEIMDTAAKVGVNTTHFVNQPRWNPGEGTWISFFSSSEQSLDQIYIYS